MTFLQIDPLSFIPSSLKTAIRDSLVDFVYDQAKKFLADEVSNKIKTLRSDGAFNRQFEEGLKKAIKRFLTEYEQQDEDLVREIANEPGFFQNKEIQKALLGVVKQPGDFLNEEHNHLIQSFQSVLPNRKNRERVDKAVLFLLKCLTEELWQLPEIQPIYTFQFQRLTAEATRQQVELQKAQLLAISDLNTGVRQAILSLIDTLSENKQLQSGYISGQPVKPPTLHNLPQPDYSQFIGREREIKQILKVLKPYPYSQAHVISIDGIGGIGKSSLALEIAYYYLRNHENIPSDERFEAIIWTSAKQTILTADGIKKRSKAFHTLDDIFTTTSITLQREDIIRASRNEQTELVRNALVQQRTLLIIDNMETIDDEDLVVFINELPAPTKAIVTTRRRIDVAYPIRLAGMPWEDAKILINHESEKKGVTLNDGDKKKLFDRTGGLPLAIVWSLAQIGYGYDTSTILSRLGDAKNDIVKFCFEGTVNSLRNSPGYILLLALSLFATDAGREPLGYITLLSELDRDDGLVQLEKLSLINRYLGRFSLLPLTKSYVSNELDLYPGKSDLYDRYFNYFHDLLSSLATSELLISAKGEYLMPERENLMALIKYCQVHNPKKAVELISVFAYFLHYFGYWADLVELCNYGLKQVGYQDLKNRAIFLSLIGRAQLFHRNYETSRNNLTEAIRLYDELNDLQARVRTSIYLAYSLEFTNSRSETRKILEEALKLSKSNNFIDLIARTQNTLASYDILDNNLEIARERLRESISIFENIDKEKARGLAPAYRLMARIELEQKNYKEAERLLIRSLEVSELTNFTLDLAYSHYKIGVFYRTTNQQSKFSKHFLSAFALFQKLGMKEECVTIMVELGQDIPK